MVCIKQVTYFSVKNDEKREKSVKALLDKYLDQYLNFLEQFSPIQPAVLLLKDMSKNGSLQDVVFQNIELVEPQLLTVCHK